jgi:cobalamin biosynthesis protein CobD/CbiB
LILGVLAAAAASSSTNDIEPGVLGFLVVAALGVALVFLLRSMNKHLRKVTPMLGAPDGDEARAQTPE